MAENQAPARNPADDATLPGVIRNAIRQEMQAMNVMMPVEVVSYDRASNRARVKHLVQMQGSDGSKVDRAEIASIRVMQPGNGAFSVSFPIKAGDKGWLMAADRDISLFQQDVDKVDAPNTGRMHSFEDGVFMPDAMKMGDVPAAEGGRVVIGANGGSAFFSFDEGSLQWEAGGAKMSMTSAGLTITVGGVTTSITSAGISTTGGSIRHNNRNIGATHTHGGIDPGNANTAVPNA